MRQSEIDFRYDLITRVLHWISAAIILWALLSGFIIFNVINDESILHFTSTLNVSLTLLLIPIFAVRIVYRAYISTQNKEKDKNDLIAHVAHACIYIITTYILISGVLMIEGEVMFFGLSLFANEIDKPIAAFFEHTHSIACRVLGVLVILHILAVIKHQMSGNRIILKMI